jgi:hypothetical protein
MPKENFKNALLEHATADVVPSAGMSAEIPHDSSLERPPASTPRKRNARGQFEGRREITDQDVANIRTLARLGQSDGAIARKLGISRPAVTQIKNGKRRRPSRGSTTDGVLPPSPADTWILPSRRP